VVEAAVAEDFHHKMQIKGTAAVTNSSQVVTAALGSDWSQAVVNGYFSLDVEGAPVYVIGSIRAPGAMGNTSSGGLQWQIVLTGNYIASTNAAVAVLLQKDFFAHGVPMFNDGDTNVLMILNRALAKLDALIGASTSALFDNARPSPADGKFQIFSATQNKYFTLTIVGAAGAEQLKIAETGEDP
jgi:hypothetical protein